MNILILVDIQNDFMDGGPLGVPGSNMIIHAVNREIDWANKNAGFIITTQDWHPKNHSSFCNPPEYRDGSWPMHCVQNTEGAEINKAIELKKATIPIITAYKGMEADKEEYSIFANKKLVTILKAMNCVEGIDQIKVCGLATDYCVAATAIDAKMAFPQTNVIVVSDACAGVATETTQKAITAMYDVGILVQ